ncbi:MAG: DUF4395 family protein [Acidimicrobiia bacterium]
MRLVDPRAGRFEQAVIVVILLAGFVFSQPWSVPIAFVVAALGVAMGDRSPVVRLWHRVFEPRLRSQPRLEPEPVARMQGLIIAAGLALATGVLLAGSVGLASLLAAVVALIAALGATAVFDLAAEIRKRRS